MSRHSAALRGLALGVCAVALPACEQADDLKDTLDGLTNTTVVAGLHLGIEPPDSSVIDLSQTAFSEGASTKVFIAQAESVGALDDSPVAGADVAVLSDSNGGRFTLEDHGDGTYTGKGSDGLSYEAEDVSVSADSDAGTHRIAVGAPNVPDASIATTHAAGQAMNVNLGGQDFDGMLVVVLDLDGGVTFSNEPSSITDLYDFAYGSSDDQLSVEIPGGAFQETGAYAVAVAGTKNSEVDDMDEVNTALSTLIAGKFRFYPVSVD